MDKAVGRNMRIAALDDDALQLDLFKQALHAMRHTCHTYLTGAQLLHSLQSERFDLLIVDWYLPDTTGPEVVRWVRQHVGLEMPILFVTHRQEERDIVEGLGCGADDFMTKPVRIGELRARVPVRNSPWARHGDFLEKRINAVEAASRQLRDLHQFVSNSLQQLRAPNFVCDAQGRTLLANVAALRYVSLGPFEPQSALQGKSIFQVLQDLQDVHTLQPLLRPDKLLAGQIPAQSEGHDAQGRSLLMLCKPFTEFANVGWLITLVDMTEIRRALQQRDQALHSSRTTSARPTPRSSRCWRCNATAWSPCRPTSFSNASKNMHKRRSAWPRALCGWPAPKAKNTEWRRWTWHPCCRMPWTTPGPRPAIRG